MTDQANPDNAAAGPSAGGGLVRTAFAERWRHALIAGVGAGLAAAVMIFYATTSATPLWLVPFATSIVLVLAAPDSPQAQPRNVLGGHVISCLAGYAVLWPLGSSPALGALALGLSVAAMVLTRTLHPPAGVNGLLVVTSHLPLMFMLVPVAAGAVLLVLFAVLYHRATRPAPWPAAWW